MTWRLCLLGVVLLASLVAPAGSDTGLSRAAAGSPGAIVFVSDRDSPGGLYLVNGDGTGLRRLAWSGGSPASNSTSGFEQPQWSPTGGVVPPPPPQLGGIGGGKASGFADLSPGGGASKIVDAIIL